MNACTDKISRTLSPLRKSSTATDTEHQVIEQLQHFGIDPTGVFGRQLAKLATGLYECQGSVDELWDLSQAQLASLDHDDAIALFNAKKFLSFQIAKILDTFQNGFRRSHQHLGLSNATSAAHGPYPLVDNVAALFSATPVIARTATYTFACADWIADAFEGREFMHPVYSRLLNPTSIALANHIVDLECGPLAKEYMAWNFNSGMAAIDSTLSHVLGHRDIVISSRNVYGGVHQLLHDWFAKPSNLDIAVEHFDGFAAEDFLACWEKVKNTHADRIEDGRQIYLYLESPCNPHGYVLDVAGLSRAAHKLGIRVILDATVGTPFLQRPLQAPDSESRPDFLIHSYTKDLSGSGAVIGGCAIARNEDMFIPKGQPGWENTMFWNVYYVKGAFLSADSAFEIMEGMRTLDLRMLHKCINTIILARYLAAHPDIRVNCNAVAGHFNAEVREQELAHGLPAPLFTFEMKSLDHDTFQRFFDNLEPVYSHQISLGQTNTTISCPGLTTHSELDAVSQKLCGIYPNTMRVSLGCESPRDLIVHFAEVARYVIDPVIPGFSEKLPDHHSAMALIEKTYMTGQQRFIQESIEVHGPCKDENIALAG